MDINDFHELKQFLEKYKIKNQQAIIKTVESWKNLYLKITDELYSKEKPSFARLKVMHTQTNDFLIDIRDKIPIL